MKKRCCASSSILGNSTRQASAAVPHSVLLARQSHWIRGLAPAGWLLGARSAQRFRCCWLGDECTRCRGGADGRGAWRALCFGLGRTRFAAAFDSGLAYAAAGNSVAPSSRPTAPATSANDVVAASDGARSRIKIHENTLFLTRCPLETVV